MIVLKISTTIQYQHFDRTEPFMKKNRARNLVQSPVQKLAEKGGFEPPRPLFGPAPLAGVCIRPLCHFSAEILPHAIAVDAYHRRDVLVSAVGSD